MPGYDEVNEILHANYGWSEFESPAPEATAAQLKVDAPSAVASKLHGYVLSVVAAGIPWNVKPEDGYEWACRQKFTTDQKYWETNTAIALGQQHELPVDSIGAANSPTEWWSHQEMLRNRLGEKLCSAEEFARRKAYVNLVPLEWSARNMDPLIWQLAVREGYMPVGAQMFDPAYLQTFPRLKDVRGLSALQWLQNLQAQSAGKPQPWLPGGDANPAVK